MDNEIELLLSESGYEHAISKSVWTNIMEANKNFLSKGPDPPMAYNNDVFRVLGDEVIRANGVLDEYDLLKDPENNPMKVLSAMTVAFKSFDELKVDLLTRTINTIRFIEERRAQGAQILVFLALPKLLFRKSTAWFLLFLWHQLQSLRNLTNAVVGNRFVMDSLFNTLKKRHPDKNFEGYTLYVDDMAYSGGQLVQFIGSKPFYEGRHLVPIVPLANAQLLFNENFRQYELRWDISQPTIVYTPMDFLQSQTGRRFVDRWGGMTELIGPFLASISSSTEPGSNKITFDNLLYKMKGLVHETSRKDSSYRTNQRVFEAVCTFYRISEIYKPIIILEHKVADNISISSRLFSFPEIEDAPFPVNTAPPLVNLQGDVEKGSKGFYSNLEWTHVPPNKDFKCLLCHGFAQFRCLSCKKAVYCGMACQKSHWKEGHVDNCEGRHAGLFVSNPSEGA
jgi:hypothetical protein